VFGSRVWWDGAAPFHFVVVWLEAAESEAAPTGEYSIQMRNRSAPLKRSNPVAHVNSRLPPSLSWSLPVKICVVNLNQSGYVRRVESESN
jgi:hypothetical protein